MSTERENLQFIDYDIMGHQFRAWFDSAHRLVFVVDESVAEYKPNVLLVLDAQENRKWDDILVNDYGVDLEDVRPKKNNKYQKLDIEYGGLGVYDALIGAYDDDENISAQLAALLDFKMGAAYRSATERLMDAEATEQKARTTVEKTNETIDELQERVKSLRAKLTNQRKTVGKEPTKQSAAKILRTESLIDATNDKLKRAKKRLQNAQHRLVAAQEDAEIAQKIIEYVQNHNDGLGGGALPATPIVTDVMPVTDAPAPMVPEEQNTEVIPYTEEEKAEEMADEEVKPLFDKDPEILDEELAFQPISFDIPDNLSDAAPVAQVPQVEPEEDIEPESAPEFVVPVLEETAQEQEEMPDFAPMAAPVLDSIKDVQEPTELVVAESESRDYEQPFVPTPIPMPETMEQPLPQPEPMPEISPAPVTSEFRPVSPITGDVVKNAAPAADVPVARRPNAVYYIMLVGLIVLSIFALWMYQGTTNDKTPELGVVGSPVIVEETDAAEVELPEISESPVIEEPETQPTAEPQSVIPQPAVEPELLPEPAETVMPEPLPAPVEEIEEVIDVEEVAQPVEAEKNEDVYVPEPSIIAPYEPEPVVIPTEEEVIAAKPAYNVSQQEKMFVADEDYEIYETDEPEVVPEEVETCSGGAMPDMDGCCPGETLIGADDGTFACCSLDTGECFPPM